MSKRTKKIEKKKKKKFPIILPILFFCVLLVCFSIFYSSKVINQRIIYKNYVTYLEKTKITQFPDITQKDIKNNIKSWLDYSKTFFLKFEKEKPELKDYQLKIEQSWINGNFEDAKKNIEETRKIISSLIKRKHFFNQTIMMEDLLTLVMDMEKSILENNQLTLMDQYNDFNTKFSFVIPVLIKTDVINIGNLMDQLYKQALFGDLKQTIPVYKDLKTQFINSYRDFIIR